jgi:hypothetical protein
MLLRSLGGGTLCRTERSWRLEQCSCRHRVHGVTATWLIRRRGSTAGTPAARCRRAPGRPGGAFLPRGQFAKPEHAALLPSASGRPLAGAKELDASTRPSRSTRSSRTRAWTSEARRELDVLVIGDRPEIMVALELGRLRSAQRVVARAPRRDEPRARYAAAVEVGREVGAEGLAERARGALLKRFREVRRARPRSLCSRNRAFGD